MEDLAWVTGEILPELLLVPKGFGDRGTAFLPRLSQGRASCCLDAGGNGPFTFCWDHSYAVFCSHASLPHPPTINAFSTVLLLG